MPLLSQVSPVRSQQRALSQGFFTVERIELLGSGPHGHTSVQGCSLPPARLQLQESVSRRSAFAWGDRRTPSAAAWLSSSSFPQLCRPSQKSQFKINAEPHIGRQMLWVAKTEGESDKESSCQFIPDHFQRAQFTRQHKHL